MNAAQNSWTEFWSDVLVLLTALRVLRMPLLVAVAAFVVFAVPAQTLEIYRSIAQGLALLPLSNSETLEIAASLIAIVALVSSLIVVNRTLLGRVWSELPNQAQSAPRLIRAVSGFVVALPIMGLSVGLFRARVALSGDLYDTLKVEFAGQQIEYRGASPDEALAIALDRVPALFRFNVWLIALAVVFLVLVIAIILVGHRLGAPKSNNVPANGHRNNWRRLATISTIGCLTVGAAIYFSVAAPRFIGPIAILCSFFLCLLIVTSALSYLSDISGFPIIWCFVLAAFIFAFLEINDNHRIRQLPLTQSEEDIAQVRSKALPDLVEEFKDWLSSRPDLKFYLEQNLPYPVYLVAAQGGGIYAALQTTSYLGTLQDECPRLFIALVCHQRRFRR